MVQAALPAPLSFPEALPKPVPVGLSGKQWSPLVNEEAEEAFQCTKTKQLWSSSPPDDALVMLLFRRLSQRPTAEELEQRNILQRE